MKLEQAQVREQFLSIVSPFFAFFVVHCFLFLSALFFIPQSIVWLTFYISYWPSIMGFVFSLYYWCPFFCFFLLHLSHSQDSSCVSIFTFQLHLPPVISIILPIAAAFNVQPLLVIAAQCFMRNLFVLLPQSRCIDHALAVRPNQDTFSSCFGISCPIICIQVRFL